MSAITDGLIWATPWLLMAAWAWMAGRWQRSAAHTLRLAQGFKWQRDCLADKLKAEGWQVEYKAERVVITRAEFDAEEERLRGLGRKESG